MLPCSPAAQSFTPQTQARRLGGDEADGASDDRRSYVCAVGNCGRVFSSASKLSRHQAIHSEETQGFPCLAPGCSKKYNRRDNMLQHYKVHVIKAAVAALAQNSNATEAEVDT